MLLRPGRTRKQSKKASAFSLLLRAYVDDPLAAVAGTKPERNRQFAILVACWLAMGYKLAFPKAQRCPLAEWIGCLLAVFPDRVEAWVTPERADDLEDETNKMLSENVIAVPRLRSYAGKVSFVASIIPTWRPFLNEIRAALKSANISRAGAVPPKTVWTVQVKGALEWFAAFLDPYRHLDREEEEGKSLGLKR